MTKCKTTLNFSSTWNLFCFVSFWRLDIQPGASSPPPPFWLTLWVISPVDVTTAKGAGREVCLTPWPSTCSGAKMKAEVTEANRRCGPSINYKLMSHRNVRHIFCCGEQSIVSWLWTKPYRDVRGNSFWLYDLDSCMFKRIIRISNELFCLVSDCKVCTEFPITVIHQE